MWRHMVMPGVWFLMAGVAIWSARDLSLTTAVQAPATAVVGLTLTPAGAAASHPFLQADTSEIADYAVALTTMRYTVLRGRWEIARPLVA